MSHTSLFLDEFILYLYDTSYRERDESTMPSVPERAYIFKPCSQESHDAPFDLE